MAPINLTENDTKLLKAVIKVMQANVRLLPTPHSQALADRMQIDWEKVRETADMKTTKYARDRWAILRAKLIDGGDATPKNKKQGASFMSATPSKRKATG